jgi:hypothetical protein
LGVPLRVGLSAASPRSFLAVGFPLLSLTRRSVAMTVPVCNISFQISFRFVIFEKTNHGMKAIHNLLKSGSSIEYLHVMHNLPALPGNYKLLYSERYDNTPNGGNGFDEEDYTYFFLHVYEIMFLVQGNTPTLRQEDTWAVFLNNIEIEAINIGENRHSHYALVDWTLFEKAETDKARCQILDIFMDGGSNSVDNFRYQLYNNSLEPVFDFIKKKSI